MINIVNEGFEIRPVHLNMIRAVLGIDSIDEYKPDSKLIIKVKDSKVYALWVNEDSRSEIEVPIEGIDEETTIKLAIYKVIKKAKNIDLPWGILTGIRPVRFLEENIKSHGYDEAKDLFIKKYMVHQDKFKLSESILKFQEPILSLRQTSYIIYIHIPYCPTRCKYCSFSVMSMGTKLRYGISEYVDYLVKEINGYNGFMKGKKAVSLYIGGGTPSVLRKEDINRIFKAVRDKFGDLLEITFEAGRPDTIDRELLNALKNNGVTRLSVNPQSLKQKTLDVIGRKHKVEDFYEAYNLCKEFEFNINTDMIVGLEGEDFFDVKNTIDELVRLEPDDITVHSLAIKNGSFYKVNAEGSNIKKNMDDIFEYCSNVLLKNSYKPYYLYRQKRQVGDNENIGYTKSKDPNIFNVLSMDDRCDVLAFGMGAVSKFTSNKGIVKRVFGFRDIDYYISHFEELNPLKEEAFNQIDNI